MLIQLAEVHTLHYEYSPSCESASEAAKSLHNSHKPPAQIFTDDKKKSMSLCGKKRTKILLCNVCQQAQMQFVSLRDVLGRLENLLTCLLSFWIEDMFVENQPNAFVRTEVEVNMLLCLLNEDHVDQMCSYSSTVTGRRMFW